MASMLKSLKLLSDPTRVRILHILSRESLSVTDLQEVLGMGQSRISTQLSQLRAGKLVRHQRSGKKNIYETAVDGQLAELVENIAAELEATKADTRRLHHLLRKQQDKTRRYFDSLAGKFGRTYVPGRSWKGLAEALLKVMSPGVVADLGAGEGTVAQLLCQRAKHVIAVDLSPKMVEFGTNLAREHGLRNLEYRLGDLESPPLDPGSLDLVIFSQALHHATHPSRALKAAHGALREGGRIIVLDLLEHEFEAARELYADQWLGFGEAELTDMLEAAGFIGVETAVVDQEDHEPYFTTLLGTGWKA